MNSRAGLPGENPRQELRKGWTTGACATAATKAAITALLSGEFPDPVSITLPKGETPAFALAHEKTTGKVAEAGIIKDAGDDPDVTHGALVVSSVRRGKPGSGVTFHAGKGVGTVTKPGLPVPPGKAAINPVPRKMMVEVVESICKSHATSADIEITISIPGGEELAEKTWNPRLGIVGGLSILGTTGVVHPFSCSAWIHSIHRGIDVCRANGITHLLGATGSTSQGLAESLHDFPPEAILDMGDFAGGVLKYLRSNPVPRLTLAGGFAKFCKLAQGHLDLHSSASQVDLDWLVESVLEVSGTELNHNLKAQIQSANTAMEALDIANGFNIDLPGKIARLAQTAALDTLREAPVEVEVLIVSRDGNLLAGTGWRGG